MPFRRLVRPLRGSLPVRGVWVEIYLLTRMVPSRVSLPVRGVWVEIPWTSPVGAMESSLPVRGVWVEMTLDKRRKKWYRVAPRAGSVG